MKTTTTAVRLALLVALLAAAATLAAILWPAQPAEITVRSAFGEEYTLYGRGLYRHDSLLIGSGFRGGDWVTLLLGAPLLVAAAWSARSRSLRGGLLLTGAIAYMLYVYASMVLGAFYNELFALYLLIFVAAFYGFISLLLSYDYAALAAALTREFPHRALAIYLYVVGAVLLIVWLGLTMLPPMLAGEPPATLEHYHTVPTYALDLGIIAPACIIVARLLQRRNPIAYPLAAALLVCSWMLGANIGASTLSQFLAGYPYSAGQVAGLVAPFLGLAVAGAWLTVRMLRAVRERVPVTAAIRPRPRLV